MRSTFFWKTTKAATTTIPEQNLGHTPLTECDRGKKRLKTKKQPKTRQKTDHLDTNSKTAPRTTESKPKFDNCNSHIQFVNNVKNEN